MSFIYRDLLTPSMQTWSMYARVYRRFDVYWGKTTINGVEVYIKEQVFWTEDAGYTPEIINDKKTSFRIFLDAIGIKYSELTKETNEGAEDVFFTLNWNNLQYTAPTTASIVNFINFNVPLYDDTPTPPALATDTEFTLNVRYTGAFGNIAPNHFIYDPYSPDTPNTYLADYTTDADAVIQMLESDPLKYFANASLENAGITTTTAIQNIQTDGSTNTVNTQLITPLTIVRVKDGKHINCCLALLDNGTVFTKVSYSNKSFKLVSNHVHTIDFQYDVTFRRIANTTTSSYVVGQVNQVAQQMSVPLDVLSYAAAMKTFKYTSNDTIIKRAVRAMDPAPFSTADMLYQGYLRVDAAKAMPYKEFATMLTKALAVDYTEKDAEWYEIAVAIIMIIVTVVITIMTYGTGTGPALAMFATALGAGAATISVGYMIYATVFPYATDMIKLIGKFAQIIGYAASIVGGFAAIQTMFNKLRDVAIAKAVTEGAKTGASKEALKLIGTTTMENYGVGQFVNDLFGKFFDDVATKFTNIFSFDAISQFKFGDLTSITLNDVSGWLDNINTSLELYSTAFDNNTNRNAEVASDQAVKEEGIEPFLVSLAMLDEVDALVKVDKMKQESFGGILTENLLIKIN